MEVVLGETKLLHVIIIMIHSVLVYSPDLFLKKK